MQKLPIITLQSRQGNADDEDFGMRWRMEQTNLGRGHGSFAEAMRLGTLPILAPSGGLKDTVEDGLNGLWTDKDMSVEAVIDEDTQGLYLECAQQMPWRQAVFRERNYDAGEVTVTNIASSRQDCSYGGAQCEHDPLRELGLVLAGYANEAMDDQQVRASRTPGTESDLRLPLSFRLLSASAFALLILGGVVFEAAEQFCDVLLSEPGLPKDGAPEFR